MCVFHFLVDVFSFLFFLVVFGVSFFLLCFFFFGLLPSLFFLKNKKVKEIKKQKPELVKLRIIKLKNKTHG